MSAAFETEAPDADLPHLLARLAAGEPVTLTRAGMPIARLVPLPTPDRKPVVFGLLKGKVWIADDFDAEDEELNALFYDGEIEPPAA